MRAACGNRGDDAFSRPVEPSEPVTAALKQIPRSLAMITTIVAVLAIVTMANVAADPVGPNALWQIVHYLCVPDEQQHGDPAPCARVDLQQGIAKGYVVLKDIRGTTQYLLLPTARIGGIESPALLAPGAANYFAASWQARTFVEAAAHRALPRDDISLAINSVTGRTQDQLHIHIDCIRADIRDTLRRNADTIETHWAPFGAKLAGHRYRALRLDQAVLGAINPFVALADDLAHPAAEMGRETLVVAGMTWPDGQPGFVLLAHRADPGAGDFGSGEELQDHACAVASETRRP